jgi:carboxymethylenebutenolidase
MTSSAKPNAFAAATQPVAQSVVTTDADGLLVGAVQIPTRDGAIPAYRAAPAKGAKHPVVLVVQEIFGVHEHIKDVARRLAKLGYLAIAPELYARQGDVSHLESIDEIRKVVARVPDAQVLADLDAAVEWAERNGGDTTRLGITGFCWGGRITWLYAAHQPKVRAGVAWYGRLEGDATELQPRHPIDIAAGLKGPVLGLYGESDQGIPLDTVERLRAELKKQSTASTIHVYPEAPHAFFADYRPSYRKAAAEDGWTRLRAWFAQHGL